MEKSKGKMDPNLLKQLRSSQIKFGNGHSHEPMQTDSQRSNEFVMAALKKRQREGGVDTVMESIHKDNKKIKERLSRTTYRIGNDRDYMF